MFHPVSNLFLSYFNNTSHTRTKNFDLNTAQKYSHITSWLYLFQKNWLRIYLLKWYKRTIWSDSWVLFSYLIKCIYSTNVHTLNMTETFVLCMCVCLFLTKYESMELLYFVLLNFTPKLFVYFCIFFCHSSHICGLFTYLSTHVLPINNRFCVYVVWCE